jgi:hypothetical protein
MFRRGAASPIWAKPAWFVWWTWSPRLTLSLVLYLLYIAYLLIRNYIEDPEKSADFGRLWRDRIRGYAPGLVFDPLVA